MAFKFSVWLRETVRLYLRYMAVGLIGAPLALVYGLAVQAGWKQKVLLPLLAVFGIVAASVVWKWLEDWQVKPQLPVNQLEIGWAELLKTAIPRGAVLQYLTPAEDTFP